MDTKKAALILVCLLLVPSVAAQNFNDLFGRVVDDQEKNFDNGICDPAENWLLDDDCTLTMGEVNNGLVFQYAWVLRLFILLRVFFVLGKHEFGLFLVMPTFGIAVYQGAFGIVSQRSE